MILIVHIMDIFIFGFVALANLSHWVFITTDPYRLTKLWYAINGFILMGSCIAWSMYGYADIYSGFIILLAASTSAGGTLSSCARAITVYKIDPVMGILRLPRELLNIWRQS